MSSDQVKAFLEKLQDDVSLQDQVVDEDADILEIAQSLGFSITADDFKAFAQLQDLSDDQLEAASGGFSFRVGNFRVGDHRHGNIIRHTIEKMKYAGDSPGGDKGLFRGSIFS